jgi:alginate O-acetyltransferase complex protein AlgI
VLFNSYEFILAFLPVTLAAFFWIGSRGRPELAMGWLVAASLFFYGWWNPAYVWLILGSLLGNFWFGRRLIPEAGGPRRRWRLVLGIALNLLVLGYYKYANFFVDSLNQVAGTDWSLGRIVLPLAISFHTFQQIAYLVDAYRGEAREYNLLHYTLFVTFFPQMMAGPIVHHSEMLPQFGYPETFRFSHANLAVGVTLFAIGLFKKVVLADAVAVYASPVFAAAAHGTVLSFFEAWGGALAYTLQIYFDFSGYSDMAVGLGRMFGIRLPINFHSPYQAVNIIDFWRRWHMTLSRFLRDYLYVPLGGNRQGAPRRYLNLFLTMLLGGLWHGAGWTFILWGLLHGFYLAVNHGWHALRRHLGREPGAGTWPGRVLGRLLTLFAVMVAWVLFRAVNLESAASILASMAGLNGVGLSAGLAAPVQALVPWTIPALGLDFSGTFPHELVYWPAGLPWLGLLLLVALVTPNSNQLLRRYDPVLLPERLSLARGTWPWPQWRPALGYALLVAAALVWSLTWMTSVSEFLYFQF